MVLLAPNEVYGQVWVFDFRPEYLNCYHCIMYGTTFISDIPIPLCQSIYLIFLLLGSTLVEGVDFSTGNTFPSGE